MIVAGPFVADRSSEACHASPVPGAPRGSRGVADGVL